MNLYFALAVLYLSLVNLVYGAQTITQWLYLDSLPMQIPLAWLVAGKLAWGTVFGLTAWGVWRLKPWGRKMALAGITLYQLHIWVNHVLFDTSDQARQVWPFAAGLSLITLAVTWAYMFLPGTRKLYERKT